MPPALAGYARALKPSTFSGMHKTLQILATLGLMWASACSSQSSSSETCSAGDGDGVSGGNNIVLLNVSDTGFAVGGLDSGSSEPNIAVQNSSNVTLTLSNVGTRPHALTVKCIPSGSPAGCPALSCFPGGANIPALDPGQSATVTFKAPPVEGAYPFISDAPDDSATDGGMGTLVGEFVLM